MIKVKYIKELTNTVLSREEQYDPNYGLLNKTVTSPYGVALKLGNDILIGVDAYNMLCKPIWEGNKPFCDLLPVLPTPVPAKICLNPKPWLTFNLKTKQYPTVYGLYETSSPIETGNRIIKLMVDYTTDFQSWVNLGISKYRLYDPTPLVYIDNPDYANYLLETSNVKNQYLNVLRKYFVITGTYVFPGLPLNADSWFENGIEIPISKDNPLAVSTYKIGYKKLSKPVPEGSMDLRYIIVMNNSISIADNNTKLKKIVGIF